MIIDYRYMLTARDLRDRFKSDTIDRHWDKITACLMRQREREWQLEQKLTGREADELE